MLLLLETILSSGSSSIKGCLFQKESAVECYDESNYSRLKTLFWQWHVLVLLGRGLKKTQKLDACF